MGSKIVLACNATCSLFTVAKTSAVWPSDGGQFPHLESAGNRDHRKELTGQNSRCRIRRQPFRSSIASPKETGIVDKGKDTSECSDYGGLPCWLPGVGPPAASGLWATGTKATMGLIRGAGDWFGRSHCGSLELSADNAGAVHEEETDSARAG